MSVYFLPCIKLVPNLEKKLICSVNMFLSTYSVTRTIIGAEGAKPYSSPFSPVRPTQQKYLWPYTL